MKKYFLLALMMIPILVVAACAPAAPKVTLPKDAIKLSDVVPAMGEHWANPANLPLGPIYLVYKGKVIGLEHMWNEDMMQHREIPTPAGPMMFKVLVPLPVGATIDHVDIALMHEGHEGFEVPHWDSHLYFITSEEQNAIKPGS